MHNTDPTHSIPKQHLNVDKIMPPESCNTKITSAHHSQIYHYGKLVPGIRPEGESHVQKYALTHGFPGKKIKASGKSVPVAEDRKGIEPLERCATDNGSN